MHRRSRQQVEDGEELSARHLLVPTRDLQPLESAPPSQQPSRDEDAFLVHTRPLAGCRARPAHPSRGEAAPGMQLRIRAIPAGKPSRSHLLLDTHRRRLRGTRRRRTTVGIGVAQGTAGARDETLALALPENTLLKLRSRQHLPTPASVRSHVENICANRWNGSGWGGLGHPSTTGREVSAVSACAAEMQSPMQRCRRLGGVP